MRRCNSRISHIKKNCRSLLVSHDRNKLFFFSFFKQVHGIGKSSGITSLEVIVGTNVSSSVNSYP